LHVKNIQVITCLWLFLLEEIHFFRAALLSVLFTIIPFFSTFSFSSVVPPDNAEKLLNVVLFAPFIRQCAAIVCVNNPAVSGGITVADQRIRCNGFSLKYIEIVGVPITRFHDLVTIRSAEFWREQLSCYQSAGLAGRNLL